jgi:hypothetical protein
MTHDHVNLLHLIDLKSDFIIIKHDGFVGPHFIKNIFSRNTLLRDYYQIIEFEALSKKYGQSFSLKLAEVKNPLIFDPLESIKLITGKEFDSIEGYKHFLDSTDNIFYHDRLLTDEFSDELLSIFHNSTFQNYKKLLFSLGLPSTIMWSQGTPPAEVWKWDLWNNAKSKMNYFDYVGLYWFGNSVEKEKAKTFLQDFTKHDYTEAGEYLDWYYKNKFNYDFDLN